jgi:putative hydrolase of the HAD superfamily
LERIKALTSPLQPLPTTAEPRLGPIDGIRAVVFDIYGTLIVSAAGDLVPTGELAARAFREALGTAGVPSSAVAHLNGANLLNERIRHQKATARANGIDHPEVDIIAVWRGLLEGLNLSPSEEALRSLALEYEFRVNQVWPMPYMRELLAELSGRGLVLGIVSNAQFYTPLMLEAFLEQPLREAGFDPACCTFSYRLLRGKPSKRIYEHALATVADKHGIRPAEVLYVGNDMRNDIWPASRVGCRTALFAGDDRSLRLRRDDPCCADVHPDRIITDLRQITESIVQA